MQDTHDWLLANGWVPQEYGRWIHPVTHDAATAPYDEEEAVEATKEFENA